MDPEVAAALAIDRDSGSRERTVDITTIGRRSAFTFHLKNGVRADLSARATRIDDEGERRRILTTVIDAFAGGGTGRNLEEWVAGAPLFAVEFDD